jgi:hypothetical protein
LDIERSETAFLTGLPLPLHPPEATLRNPPSFKQTTQNQTEN